MSRFDDINREAGRATSPPPIPTARIDLEDEDRPWRQRSGATVWSERVLRRWQDDASSRGWARCASCGEAMLPVGRLDGVWVAMRDPRVLGWRLAGDQVLRRARHHTHRLRVAEKVGAAERVEWPDLTWPLPIDIECPQCHRRQTITAPVTDG